MKFRILRWLLGIWLVETVAARHIRRDDEHVGNVENRFARDQSHRTFLPDSHLNYNAFRTPIRRAPPQVPGRQDGIEPHNQYSNYFGGSTNGQNVYSAVRLHGALEVRANAEPGSNTLISNNGHQNYYNQQDSQKIPERHFRRDTVDEDSAEGEDDLARFSLYNSYFDNEHSIKALNSMKCVTPTGSAGFCSTFRGCVPSFFTREGDLEAPALAELISTSIGYCTTNVSHHFIREQRQHEVGTSREERRFNSVANRIICCPGTAPPRDSNQDPDKIFNDYLESQKNKHKTTTTTTTTEQPQEPENAIDGSDNSMNQNQPDAGAQEDGVSSPVDGQVSNENGSQTAPDAQQQPSDSQNVVVPEQPIDSQNVEAAPEQPIDSQNIEAAPEQPIDSQNIETASEQPSGSQNVEAAPEQPIDSQNVEAAPEKPIDSQNVEAAPEQPNDGQNIGAPADSMLPEQTPPVNEPIPSVPDQNQQEDTSMNPEAPDMMNKPAMSEDADSSQSQQNEAAQTPAEGSETSPSSQHTVPDGASEESSPPSSQHTIPDGASEESSPPSSQHTIPDGASEESSPPSSQHTIPDGASEESSPPSSQHTIPDGASEESSPPSSQHTIPDGASEESSPPTEEQALPVNQENQSAPPSSNDEATPGSEQSQPSPGKLPQQTQASNIIKIFPDPVSGVNGKFTLPGGIYIYSTTDNPNQPKPVHPPGEQGVGVPDETMVDSKPIIIVTNPIMPAPGSDEDVDVTGIMPEEMMPTFPQFPGEFPPMGSAENPIPPVDDSSLELQQRPVARPVPDTPMMIENEVITSSTAAPSSSSSSVPELPQTTLPAINDDNQMNDDEVTTASSNMQYAPGHTDYYEKIPMTTNEPEVESVAATTQRISSSGDLQMQEDESDAPLITTSQPAIIDSASEASQGITASSDSITTSSSSPSNENDENGAVTILPEVGGGSSMTGSSEKSGPTTQIPVEADFMTTIKSEPGASTEQQQQQQGVNEITTISSGSVDPQGVEVTTTRQAAAVGSQEAIETTTFGFIKAQTTLTPDDEESSEESDEDIRQQSTTVANQADAASGDDIQRTTVAASTNFDLGTTTTSPILAEGSGSDQEDESLPTTQSSAEQQQQNENEIDSTTQRIVPAAQDQDDGLNSSNNVQEGSSLSPDNESTTGGAEYTTPLPPQSASQTGESEDSSKIILNPGSEISDQQPEGVKEGSVGGGGQGKPESGTDDFAQQQVPTGEATETIQPFPVSSPAPTGEDQSTQQGNDDSTNSQQLFPGSESGTGAAATTESPLQDSEQPIPESEPESIAEPVPTSGGEPQQSFPEGASTTTGPSSFDDEQPIQGTEQSIPSSETSPTSESSQTTNDRESSRLPTTGSPIASGNEQDEAADAEAEPTVGSEAPISGSEQSSVTGGGASTDGYPVSSPGSDATGATSESSYYPGVSTISDGTESSTPGSESLVTGTESSISGSEASTSGAESSTQGADSSGSGNEESFIPNPGSESASSDSQSASPSQSSGSSPPTGGNESSSVAPVEPIEPGSDAQPPYPEPSPDDTNASDNELPISSSSPAAPTTDRPTATESVSQDAVPSVPSEPTEDAPSMQGPDESADSPISSDNMQNPEPIISTTHASQDVSSAAPAMNTTTEASLMQELSTEPAIIPPKEIVPNYQILKACKFQSFFRSASEQGYSYRHYPWLATIVGGTRPFSSGTLITDRHILTASHFLANITVSDVFNMRIHIGYRTSYSGQTEGPYAVRKVRKVIRHKGFSFEKLYNDIAVLVLDRPVRFTEDIYPVCLSSNRNSYADGTTEAVETGWIEDPRTYHISQHHNYIDPHIQKYFSFGYKNITWRLQEAPQRVRTNQECQANYGFLEKNGIGVTDSMVCAGSGDTRSCAFRGNSGAPLFVRNDDNKMSEQIGIVSWGISCGFFPFVFTRVESFLPWLDRVVYNSR